MIRVSLPWLFFFYLLSFLALIFFVWVVSETHRRSQRRRALRGRTQCRLCGCLYRLEGRPPPSACPRCGAQNEHQKIRLL